MSNYRSMNLQANGGHPMSFIQCGCGRMEFNTDTFFHHFDRHSHEFKEKNFTYVALNEYIEKLQFDR